MGALQRLYDDEPHLADEVLKGLQGFPVVTQNAPMRIREFANNCNIAYELSQTEQGEILLILNCREVQNTVTSRLDKHLRDRWARQSAKILASRTDKRIPFSEFCKWIDEVEKECCLRA